MSSFSCSSSRRWRLSLRCLTPWFSSTRSVGVGISVFVPRGREGGGISLDVTFPHSNRTLFLQSSQAQQWAAFPPLSAGDALSPLRSRPSSANDLPHSCHDNGDVANVGGTWRKQKWLWTISKTECECDWIVWKRVAIWEARVPSMSFQTLLPMSCLHSILLEKWDREKTEALPPYQPPHSPNNSSHRLPSK